MTSFSPISTPSLELLNLRKASLLCVSLPSTKPLYRRLFHSTQTHHLFERICLRYQTHPLPNYYYYFVTMYLSGFRSLLVYLCLNVPITILSSIVNQ
jgi:hypothetical protein